MPGNSLLNVGFTVGDPDTPAASLVVTVTSSLQSLTLLPFTGTGESRILRIASGANQLGSIPITLTVSDGVRKASATFQLTITRSPAAC
jgi:hypothetical protein